MQTFALGSVLSSFTPPVPICIPICKHHLPLRISATDMLNCGHACMHALGIIFVRRHVWKMYDGNALGIASLLCLQDRNGYCLWDGQFCRGHMYLKSLFSVRRMRSHLSTLSLPWHGIHVKLDHQNAGCAFWRFVREV